MTTRWELMAANEAATAAVLREHGNEPLVFGAAMLSARARQLQQQEISHTWPPDLNRWLQDNIVRTRTGEVVYADAKFAQPGRVNHSIEMRSMLAGQLQTRPVWYVCSRRAEGQFVSFQAIELTDVPTDWPCCGNCQTIYLTRSVHDANAELPQHCPTKRDTVQGGSGTSYFVIRQDSFKPDDPFGLNPTPVSTSPFEKVCSKCGHQPPGPGGVLCPQCKNALELKALGREAG